MKNILIVDDSAFARRGLKKILTDAGYNVEEAKDGPEALEKYFLRKPDLVLVDVVMEGMDGLQVLRKLKEMDPDADVVMASADIQKSTEAEAKSFGAAGYLKKPFNPDDVVDTLKKILAGGVAQGPDSERQH